MAVVVNNKLVEKIANLLFGRVETSGIWTVRLFVNLHFPLATDVAGNYTECSIPGYSAQILQPGEWDGGIVAPGVVYFTYPQLTWTFDAYAGGQSIFGYYVMDDAGDLIYSELFPSPFPVPPAGGTLPIILTWQDEQCPA